MRRAEEMKQIPHSKASSAADTSAKTSQSSQTTNCKYAWISCSIAWLRLFWKLWCSYKKQITKWYNCELVHVWGRALERAFRL